MTTHRRYFFVHPGPWTIDGGHAKILEILRWHASRYWQINEPVVEGEPFGRLTFAFTSSDHDQWYCHQRAMRVAKACYIAVGLSEKDIPDPLWEPLEPHTNRGRYRTPA